MTISLIGLSLEDWDPTLIVKRWLRTAIHHTGDDGRIKAKKIASEDTNQEAIWKYLKQQLYCLSGII